MYRVTRDISFCYGHRLLDYAGKCRHLHGHNGIARIVLEGPSLDGRGMLIDFTEIKSRVQTWIDETLDHTMLLRGDDPIVPVLESLGERYLTMKENPTAENIARMIYEHCKEARLPVREVMLWETESCHAAYGEAGDATRQA